MAALVGATDAWLRRPFLYFGVLQGVGARACWPSALAAGFGAALAPMAYPVVAAALALPGVRGRRFRRS